MFNDAETGSNPPESPLPYNPDQDPEEKRELRRKYRKLVEKLQEHQLDLNAYPTVRITNHVKEADVLFKKVLAPPEAILDSTVLLVASTMSIRKARAMKSSVSAFDVEDFMSKLITFMGGRRQLEDQSLESDDESELGDGQATLDWPKIARKALAKSRRVTVMDFMLGPLAIQQKKRSSMTMKRAKLSVDKQDERRPQELKEDDISRSLNETTKNVAALFRLLIHEGTINLFRFIVNPDSFAQSVENMFHLSFLIRDGKVALEMDPGTAEPHIYACESPEDSIEDPQHQTDAQDPDKPIRKNQMIMEFDMPTWRVIILSAAVCILPIVLKNILQHAIEVFSITDCKIPHRTPAKTRLSNQWYG